ncbi:MAG: response regulator [Thaumarchaeota archaeon]|nr:response regulator [Nitrososphaerota archaeon]
MVRSTQEISQINDATKIRKYYSIFLNSLAVIARNFGAKIVKNVGDSLIIYFPNSLDSTNKEIWSDILECLLALMDARSIINTNLYQEGLSSVNYRISADYGKVEVARSMSSKEDDLFGATMNMCSKINSFVPSNNIALGGDMYQVIRYLHLDKGNYSLTELGEYSTGHKFAYPVYILKAKQSRPESPFRRTSKLLIHNNLKNSIRSQKNKKSDINIMLVDDESATLSTFQTILVDENYHVDAFRNGEDAIRNFVTVPSSHYDLIVSDVRMSPINGLELYNKLRELSPSVKMIFVSALDGLKEIVSIMPEIKQSQILQKPVSKERFVEAVKMNLGYHAT